MIDLFERGVQEKTLAAEDGLVEDAAAAGRRRLGALHVPLEAAHLRAAVARQARAVGPEHRRAVLREEGVERNVLALQGLVLELACPARVREVVVVVHEQTPEQHRRGGGRGMREHGTRSLETACLHPG